jgi:hypothetical protein
MPMRVPTSTVMRPAGKRGRPGCARGVSPCRIGSVCTTGDGSAFELASGNRPGELRRRTFRMSPIQIRTVTGALLLAVCAACSGGSNRQAAPTTTNTPRSSTTSSVAVGRAARCPRILPDRVASAGVANLSERLVPLSAIRLTVCRYGPLVAAAPLTVKTQFTVVDRATVTDFEAAANLLAALAPGPLPNCQEDDGEALVLIFSDVSHAVTVRASLSGARSSRTVFAPHPRRRNGGQVSRASRSRAARPRRRSSRSPPCRTTRADGRSFRSPRRACGSAATRRSMTRIRTR